MKTRSRDQGRTAGDLMLRNHTYRGEIVHKGIPSWRTSAGTHG
jgi:hypothetical protein